MKAAVFWGGTLVLFGWAFLAGSYTLFVWATVALAASILATGGRRLS